MDSLTFVNLGGCFARKLSLVIPPVAAGFRV